eukprot:m.29022 g.29022  ORF g.29022 m.29022 type:complete len:118 (+) comp10373_c0_seq1:2-355(+)
MAEAKQPFAEGLRNLCLLHGLLAVERGAVDMACLAPAQRQLVKTEIHRVLKLIRPMAVVLVDAFDLSDHYLASALGRYDGNVYEALYKLAQREPLNKTTVSPAIKKHLHPLLGKSKL